MKLTITITGRNDNHANYFVNRLCASVSENIKLLSKYLNPKFKFEYLIVDWCSKEKYLHEHEKIKKLLSNKEVKFIIVPPSIIKEKYGHERFYQFFAKNVGIRHADGEWVLLINADNILNELLIKNINSILLNNDSNIFYRVNYWRDIDITNNKTIKTVNCKDGKPDELGLAPTYSGDFLLCKKQTLIDKGRGHDESNKLHQTELPQAHMDGEILFNLKKNGVTPVILNNYISHISHPRSKFYDDVYNKNGYTNTINWGFAELKKTYINKQVVKLISDSDNNDTNNMGNGVDLTSSFVEDKSLADIIVEVNSSIPEPRKPVDIKSLLKYSDSIHCSTTKGFRPISVTEIISLLSRSKFPFNYAVKKRGDDFPNEIFIVLTSGDNKARCPVNPDQFIKTRS